ncbi:type II toxin-antitoxin system RelE/ParE family toxin [Amphiplicatus metriothermophilus]|uniref:Putative addiction module killer protein n=1 Tax=Amphiplicatus metriothermophilus TaxID=1519374 RepID=A0A239PL10_9PROT|nr:type II toxin-antitoxin system RelE/ParE family toxin [Amphiplicatus metriothermophilus]MBB5517415.1 putative addiction module killer protein [Amphiplicatus metriothermophilus]SNT68250.1 putative addiction module killer protein [Amphiplicatus metriothermophilus]
MRWEIRKTEVFARWLDGLKDRKARAVILRRLMRVEEGNFGDHASVGQGVMELRIHYGPGYRLYYVRRGECVIVLLAGGDKSAQKRDIALARTMAGDLDV